MNRRQLTSVAVLAGSALCAALPSWSQDFRPGRPPLPEVALAAPAHGQRAVAALAAHLPGVARHYDLTEQRLRALFLADDDLWVDRGGRLFFAESHVPAPGPVGVAGAADATGAEAQAALVPLDQTFLLHSRPSATKKIYLDFNGHTTTGTSWTDIKDGDGTFVTPAYDFDGNAAAFGTTELERIQYIWQRVAEDYSSFDVDVTTEDPGVEGLRKTTAGDVDYGIRVCIGGASTDWYSTGGYGGVAYIGSFDWSSDTPCFVFENNLSNGNEKYVAEAVSHEVGHALDLYHDGTSTLGYYQGHGTGADGWAPIMGVGYYQPVVQFSRGEYLDANNTEDDLAKITASYNIPYLADDHGNLFESATVLPEGAFDVGGFIERNTDIDVFRITAGAGTFAINVLVDGRSPNLNVEATLYDAGGSVVAVSNPADSLAAAFSLPGMAQGVYYLVIDGVGAGNPLNTGYSGYGSIGTYRVTGTLPVAGFPLAAGSATPSSGIAPLSVQFSSAGSSDPDGGALFYAWSFGDGRTSSDPDPAVVYATPGNFTAVLTVTDVDGHASSTSFPITVSEPLPSAPTDLTGTAASSTRINLAWTDNASNETGFRVERSVNGGAFAQIATLGANVVSYADTTVSGGVAYAYRVRASNATGFSDYSNTASVTTPVAAPAAPTSLSARAASKTQINLSWRDNANNESGVYVERSSNGTTWTRIATLGANATQYSATGLTANTTYSFRVQAYNASGASAYSNTASTKTKR